MKIPAPSWIPDAAKALWKKHRDRMTDPRDVPAYTLLIVSLAEWRLCVEQVAKDGRDVATAAGNPKAHPLIASGKQYADTAARLLSKFGMTPADRSEPDPETGDASRELDDLLAS